MTKASNSQAKKRKSVKKRGPKEERLIIAEDPQVALDRLLKRKPDGR